METNLKRKKVCIMGFAPTWEKTPFEDKDFEIWTLNEAYKLLNKVPTARVDRWFEIHSRNSPSKNNKEHLEFLKTCGIPLYMQEKYEDMPTSIEFPFKEVINWLKDKGHIGYRYFTNSISWMIAFALLEGFEEIWVTGVDMAQDNAINGTSEYAYQKPSCEYMLGVAEKYSKVWLPEDSDLLYCENLYGIESDNSNNVWLKKQIKGLGDRSKQYDVQYQQAMQAAKQSEIAIAELRGAKEAYRQVLKKRL